MDKSLAIFFKIEIGADMSCLDGSESLKFYAERFQETHKRMDPSSIDAAFLDIRMPTEGPAGGEDGMDAGAVAQQRGIPVVFVTADAGRAVEAFQQGAAHYLLKPITAAALAEAVERLDLRKDPERLAIPSGGDVVLVDAAAITHAVFDGNLVTVHADGESWLADGTLQDLERRLGTTLVRVHRRALLNLNHVTRLRSLSTGGYVAIVGGGQEVPVSRQSARELRKQLGL